MNADRLEFYRNQVRGVPVRDLGRKLWEVLVAATEEAAHIERESNAADVATLEQEARQVRARLARVEKERDELRGFLVALLDDQGVDRNDGNAPGHCHNIPGVWDSDNGKKAGKQCSLCAAWNKAKQIIEDSRHEALEREHLGDPEKKTGIYFKRPEDSEGGEL